MKQAKQETWEEFGRKIEENYIENQKQFWNIVKKLKGNQQQKIRNIRNEKGELQTKTEDILSTWKKHYTKTFKEDRNPENEYRGNQEQLERIEINEEISLDEVSQALNKTKNGKAAGPDDLAPELLKKGGQIIINWLKNIYTQAWETETIPEEWEQNIIAPIYKKGDTTDVGNYRTICLSSVALKIYSRILEKRLRSQMEHRLEEEQGAFRPGRQTQDHIFSVRATIEKMMEKNRNLYLAFLDLKAAFDQVPRPQIWATLEKLEVTPKLIQAIKSLYKNIKAKVRLNGQTSEEFRLEKGIKQGDSLSPLLFIIYMDNIHKKCKRDLRKATLGYHNLSPIRTEDLIYADDIIIMATSVNQLSSNINIWKKTLEENGMTLNLDKSKTLCVSKDGEEERIRIQLDGKELEQVRKYEYLGTTISMDGRIDEEIKNRISKANKIYYQINNTLIAKRELSIKAKTHLYKTIFVPTLTYAAESWTILDKHRSKITASEMKYLRRSLGKTKRDRIRNRNIREVLEIEALTDLVEKKQLQWYGHLTRMNNERNPKKIYNMKCEGRRGKGRPRMKWEENIKTAAAKRNINQIGNLRDLAQDRKKFRKWLNTPTP